MSAQLVRKIRESGDEKEFVRCNVLIFKLGESHGFISHEVDALAHLCIGVKQSPDWHSNEDILFLMILRGSHNYHHDNHHLWIPSQPTSNSIKLFSIFKPEIQYRSEETIGRT